MKATTAKTFKADAGRMTADLRHRGLIQRALSGYEVKRDEQKGRFVDWGAAREAAGRTKWEAINHLDRYLDEFARKIAARGAKVFWASTAEEARTYIAQVALREKVRTIIKSKSMTAEEIHLNAALEEAGVTVIESDLGEFIVQLREEPPYHLVFPSMHLTRDEISEVFQKKLGADSNTEPEHLTLIARERLRKRYLEADMGICGVNFAVAETGMIAVTENEGNARLSVGLPRIQVALMGIEKIVPKLSDLALFWPMLATAGAGQPITGYNTLYSGPRQPGETDGPEQMHVVILDNGRTRLLADAEQRDALHCIRCGACLNVCPIFKNVGGHSYGTTYQGPIGSVITPHLRGLQAWRHLSFASSLCGACTEACPVGIDLHHHLLHNRRNANIARPGPIEKLMFGAFVFLMKQPLLFQLAGRLGALFQPLHKLVDGGLLDPLRVWTKARTLPVVAPKSFSQLWAERRPRKP
jgi:L-lactate dehydrogenase complex protein LldF